MMGKPIRRFIATDELAEDVIEDEAEGLEAADWTAIPAKRARLRFWRIPDPAWLLSP